MLRSGCDLLWRADHLLPGSGSDLLLEALLPEADHLLRCSGPLQQLLGSGRCCPGCS